MVRSSRHEQARMPTTEGQVFTLTRRSLLGLAVLAPWLPACSEEGSDLAKKLQSLPLKPISAEELELLRDKSLRKARQAKQGLPEAVPLEIRDRVFGDQRQLLRGADIANVRFVNCRFEMFQGYDNNLDQVMFEECLFLGGVFTGPFWSGVEFIRCKADGPFEIGCADGEVSFTECVLKGMSAEEGGGGNWADHFGLATGQDGKASFVNCKLDNLLVGGAELLSFVDCELGDLSAHSRSCHGVLVVKNAVSRVGRQMFDGDGIRYSSVIIFDSKLPKFHLTSVSVDEMTIENGVIGVEMGGYGTEFGELAFRNVVFQGEGLNFSCASNVDSLLVDSCSFESRGAGQILLFGEPNRSPSPDRPDTYWSRIKCLEFRNQKIVGPRLDYIQVGSMKLDHVILEGANLSHSHFGTIEFIDSKLTGTLDLTDTTIQHIDNRGLINDAKVLGKLEADPQAPAPDLVAFSAPKAARGKSGEKLK